MADPVDLICVLSDIECDDEEDDVFDVTSRGEDECGGDGEDAEEDEEDDVAIECDDAATTTTTARVVLEMPAANGNDTNAMTGVVEGAVSAVTVSDDTDALGSRKRARTEAEHHESDSPAHSPVVAGCAPAVVPSNVASAASVLREQPVFVGFDLEFSHPSHYKGSIIQFAAVVATLDGPIEGVDPFDSYVKPDRGHAEFLTQCTRVHGIQKGGPELQAAPTFFEMWARFCAWLQQHRGGKPVVLVGHNIKSADLPYLLSTLERHASLELPPYVSHFADTYVMLRKYISPLKKRLVELGGSFKLNDVFREVTQTDLTSHHNAACDAAAACHVLAHPNVRSKLSLNEGVMLVDTVRESIHQKEVERRGEIEHVLHGGWQDVPHTQRNRKPYASTSMPRSGPAGPAAEADTLLELWLSLLPVAFWQESATHTAAHSQQRNGSINGEVDCWLLMSAIALHMAMGVLGYRTTKQGWHTEFQPASGLFTGTMSRFQL
eukprot:m.438317 g.438317  ORF g.438317 m.438317 type:complete len:492 (-) comp20274_c3_seq25:1981-3456(-)